MKEKDNDNVVSIVDEIEERKSVERYARLWGLVEHRQEEIRRNPDKFIKEAYERVAKYERLLNEMRTVCLGQLDFHFDPSVPMRSPSMEAVEKLSKIEKLLWDQDAA